jgi:hypothetical protein
MLDHLETTPGALPLLQFTAAKLWETRDIARRLLTRQSYVALGGVAGALASHADRVVADIGPQKQALIRALLLRLVTAERTRAIVPIAELLELSREVGEVQRLVDQMVDARLLVVQTLEGGKGSTVEIVHESLVQGWPTLRRWLDENQDDAALVDQLRIAARQWQAKNFDSGLLWRGDSASEARKFRVRYKGPLSDVERGFLDAVIHQEAAQARRRRTAIIAGFTTLSTIVVATMVLLVVVQKSRTQAKEKEAEAITQRQIAEERLDQKEKAEAARLAAEKATKAAEQQTAVITEQKAVVDVELNKSKEDLIKERDTANANALAAERAQRRAEDNERLAQKSQKEAVTAQDETTKAYRELQKALDREHKRVVDLENAIGSKPISDLKK